MSTPQATEATTVGTTTAVPPGGYVPPQTLLRVTERSAGVARAEVRRALRRWGMRELIADASLVACELVANAVVHVRRERSQLRDCRIGFTVRRVCGGVVIELHDHGVPKPLAAPPSGDRLEEGGRGLLIVDALTGGAWGTAARPGGPGKVVWALLPVPAAAVK